MAIRLLTPLDHASIADIHSGTEVLLTGTIFTARDAAHRRFKELLDRGEKLPVDLAGQIVYYCGPAPAKPGRPIGSAGPTTSSRMDPYTPALIAATGLKGMIGKGERSPAVVDAIVKYGCVYFAAIGGAGALIARSVVSSECACYEDLGPEAVYKLEVRELPLVVAIDSKGSDIYSTGREKYRR